MATHASADACYHCGETLPANAARIQINGVTHQFCCDGCAAAAQWIDDADLEAYYRLRERPGSRMAAGAFFMVWEGDAPIPLATEAAL